MKVFKPRIYQEPMVEKMCEEDFYGLLAFPGAGKTVVALKAIYHHRQPTLIIAPLSILHTVWTTEHLEWDFSQTAKIAVMHGPDKLKAFLSKSGIYLINPEGMPWLLEQMKKHKRFPWANLIVDESVKFKNHKSKRFKVIKSMLKSFKRRYILCANPMPNRYSDIWAQIYLLDLGKRLGTSFYQFQNRYFYPTDYRRFNWELKPNAHEEIVEAIKDIVTFIDVSDELDLPERVIVDHDIQLPKEIMADYKSMEKELFFNMGEGQNVLAANKTSALMKCWQIANGFMYYYEEDDPEERHTKFMHNKMAETTVEIVDELQGSPIIIAYWFNEDYKRLRALFGDAPHIGSSTTITELKKYEGQWNKGEIPVLLAHISKVSHGLNLQFSGHNVLFYALTYNYDTYDQLIRRLERQGSKNARVIVHRLIAKGTIHEAIVKSLEGKCTMSSGFLEHLKEYRDEQLK